FRRADRRRATGPGAAAGVRCDAASGLPVPAAGRSVPAGSRPRSGALAVLPALLRVPEHARYRRAGGWVGARRPSGDVVGRAAYRAISDVPAGGSVRPDLGRDAVGRRLRAATVL